MTSHQSRLMSFYEALINTLVGFGVSYLLVLIAFPWFGFPQPTSRQSVSVVMMFTVTSLARGYLLRRVFEWLRRPGRA